MSGNLAQKSWEKIFQALPIESEINANGFFDISADEIKKYGNREPRLMAKIDFKEQLPEIMRKKNFALLAIENGLYRIGRFNPFIEIPERKRQDAQKVLFPQKILTIRPQDLAHESAMLDAAKISGILEKTFGEKTELTLRGRSRSPDFSFSLNEVNFHISGVQVEVDGGYEGEKSFHLVEAKIGGRRNISVRQLLYPQLSWEQKLSAKKEVKSYLCFYEAPVIRFIPLLFRDKKCLVDEENERNFQIESYPERFELETVSEKNELLPFQERVPFPQADDFSKILAMFSFITAAEKGAVEKSDLLAEFDIVPRQIDYYTNALCWLGLFSMINRQLSLTAFGQDCAAMSHAERIEALAKIIFKNPVFYFVLHHSMKDEHEIAKRFQHCGVMARSTQTRRLQTVQAWIKYFRAQTQEA